ncbi:MAG: hypothetical protein IJQ82_06730 [Selenomonadaceae bacterium]|nr:hypothetical protein [Selenomonadaceae bacterium]
MFFFFLTLYQQSLTKRDERKFINAQSEAGTFVESQSAGEVQKNIKAFKQLRADKKLPDNDKPFTIVPETVDVLRGVRVDIIDEKNDDSPATVDRAVSLDTLPVFDTLSR